MKEKDIDADPYSKNDITNGVLAVILLGISLYNGYYDSSTQPPAEELATIVNPYSGEESYVETKTVVYLGPVDESLEEKSATPEPIATWQSQMNQYMEAK